jgi:hypothetical protein
MLFTTRDSLDESDSRMTIVNNQFTRIVKQARLTVLVIKK